MTSHRHAKQKAEEASAPRSRSSRTSERHLRRAFCLQSANPARDNPAHLSLMTEAAYAAAHTERAAAALWTSSSHTPLSLPLLHRPILLLSLCSRHHELQRLCLINSNTVASHVYFHAISDSTASCCSWRAWSITRSCGSACTQLRD